MISSLQAQHQLSGKVKDEKNEAVPFANVLLLNVQDSSLVKGTITDTTGHFALENVAQGNYLVSSQMVGYDSYYSEAMKINKNLVFNDIRMIESTTELSEVVVSAAKPMLEVTPNALVVNVEFSPILQNGTALEVLEKSPGVTVDQDGNISVKGKANVLVYLDGKPTYLSDSDLSQLLESTSAENISKIEIMDNPPAKYDAAGNAGIINIVRKKSADLGFNGNVSLGAGYGEYPKLNPSLNLNFRSEKINLFGNYSHYYAKRFSNTDIFRNIPFENENGEPAITTFDQSSRMINWVHSNNFRTGADWYVAPKSTIGVLVSGNFGNWNGDAKNTTLLGGEYNNPFDGLNASNRSGNAWNNITYNLNFKQELSNGSQLSFDADYAIWDRENYQKNDNFYFSNEGTTSEPPLLVRTNMNTNIDILAIKTDYTATIFGRWGLETGLKTSNVATDNNLDFNTLEGEVLQKDTLRSNRFQYDETINAGYVNVSKKFNDAWNIQAGLRGEYTSSKGYSVTLDSAAERQYFNLFPSASVSYTMSEIHSFALSYSRRIDRPNYGNLNPFEFFLDAFTFERGNPFLNPQYTNAYGLNYGFKSTVFLTLNYNETTDAITQVLEQDEASQKTYQTTVNLDKQKNYSANIAAPLPITQWWMLNLNLTGFHNIVESPFSEGDQINKSQWSYTARAQNTFTLPGDVKLEIMGMYQSPQLWGIFEIQEQYQVDAGVSKSLGKLKIQASLDDVFNIRNNRVNVLQGDIDTVVKNKWESRVFMLNLSYRFGNDKVKQARSRGTASDDLRQRAN
ncbi:outer membrane beta-barrel family protein [Catalinimonas niigatensis]|uniref:outer membrane beta-barrel family protein n=1 Tax=Catalinimonas niigatensis TaxID=1397264 RepID=UPI00266701D9|nr:outer membrane beta-barrel family protein [Catalinimonas niigatensis]WPP49840.1 outer membrane beta-barrel family protein [Catalinimonas niigatensis]